MPEGAPEVPVLPNADEIVQTRQGDGTMSTQAPPEVADPINQAAADEKSKITPKRVGIVGGVALGIGGVVAGLFSIVHHNQAEARNIEPAPVTTPASPTEEPIHTTTIDPVTPQK